MTTESPETGAHSELESPPLDRVIEAILFAHEGIVTVDMLAEALPDADPRAIRAAIASLEREYDESGRSFEIVRIAGGFQICTRERWATWVARFQRGNRRARLSRAAIETAAIVAYRQPITRTSIEEIRGVDSGAVLGTLLERNLITVRGRGPGVGRPLLYGTTLEFLEYLGLDRLEDLPRLDEIESLLKEREGEERIEASAEERTEAPAEEPIDAPVSADEHTEEATAGAIPIPGDETAASGDPRP